MLRQRSGSAHLSIRVTVLVHHVGIDELCVTRTLRVLVAWLVQRVVWPVTKHGVYVLGELLV